MNHLCDPIDLSPFSLKSHQLENLTLYKRSIAFCYCDLYFKNETLYEFQVIDFLLLGPKEEFDMHYNLIEACWLF